MSGEDMEEKLHVTDKVCSGAFLALTAVLHRYNLDLHTLSVSSR
jgi:hypothetical protein